LYHCGTLKRITAVIGNPCRVDPGCRRVGPLTAQALTVRHGPKPAFEAEYHGVQALWRWLSGLEWSHQEDHIDEAGAFRRESA
jgi:hypothetical protein